MTKAAMFAGLVVDEKGNPVDVAWVGNEPCYVVMDDGFKRHIDAASVDRQVLRYMKEQVEAHRDLAVSGILQMMGRDDLFTKAAIEFSINKMEDAVGQPIPEEARSWLGMLGFRIVIDVHGNVVSVDMPAGSIDEDDL
ncbi:MAG TPA: hypothetical protein EYH31_07125 [Anaerolineae bacterium]|nr:hypothetical protein [Anaerolineae bacterium]